MSDPISGAGGGAAKLALQEMMKQQQQQQIQNPAGGQVGQSSFQSKMNSVQQTQQPQNIAEIQKSHQATKTRSIRDMAGVNSGQGVNPSQKAQNAQFGKANAQDGNFSKGVTRLMESMKSRKAEVDSLIQKAMNGKNFNNRELLVLQYKISSFSMEMDLISKVVDKTTGGIKQAMNTQV